MAGTIGGWMLAAMLGGAAAGAQGTSSTVKDDLFNGTEKFAKGASDVTEVTMDPDTLGMVSGRDQQRARGMVLNVVRTYEYDRPGMYNIADVEEFRRKLDTGDWHCSVHTRSLKSGESTDICSKRRTDGLVEQAIITVEPKELTFIHTVKHADSRMNLLRDGGPGESMWIGPGLAGSEMNGAMARLGPEMEAHMAVMEARLAVMQPLMEARMAAIGPEMEARIAAAQARSSTAGSGAFLGSHTAGHAGLRLHVPAAPIPPTPPDPQQ